MFRGRIYARKGNKISFGTTSILHTIVNDSNYQKMIGKKAIQQITDNGRAFDNLTKEQQIEICKFIMALTVGDLKELAERFRTDATLSFLNDRADVWSFLSSVALFVVKNNIDLDFVQDLEFKHPHTKDHLVKIIAPESPLYISAFCWLKWKTIDFRIDDMLANPVLTPLAKDIFGAYIKLDIKCNGAGFDSEEKMERATLAFTKNDLVRLQEYITVALDDLKTFEQNFSSRGITILGEFNK